MTLIRKINLVEILKEEAEEQGLGDSLPDDLTEQQLEAWSEDQIRQYYAAGSQNGALPPATAPAPSPQPALNGTAAAGPSTPAQQQPHTHSSSLANPLTEQQLQQLQARFPCVQGNPQQASTFQAWFPGLALSKTAVPNPSAVVLCFHSSGNAEDIFTSEGTGSRRAVSPLLEVCRARGWQVLAAQLPGRGLRAKEAPLETLQEVARQLLPLVAPALVSAGGRYALVGHSMGCWAAYELLLLLREMGFPEPAVACLSAMPWPHIPLELRPWRQQAQLNEEQFKEECRGWDINDVVFSPGMWGMYQPMLRADFKLFDEYVPSSSCSSWEGGQTQQQQQQQQGQQQGRFSFPLRLFWGSGDRRVTQEMVQKWSSYTTGPCTGSCIHGNHLFPLQPAAKQQWLNEVAVACQAALHSL